jgi:hypothetical protein
MNDIMNNKELAISQAECIDGFMTHDELCWLFDHAAGDCVEIGSYKGRSATAIASKLMQSGGHLTCIDVWHENFDIFQENMRQLNSFPSILKADSLEAAEHFSAQSLDFVFLDSSHEYSPTLAEIIFWSPKLKETGILCGHDYGHPDFPGVAKALSDLGLNVSNPIDSIWMIHKSELNVPMALYQFLRDPKFYLNLPFDLAASEKNILQQEIDQINQRISAMESTKFWKLRNVWRSIKQRLGLFRD